MKKILLLCSILIIGLFSLTGCGIAKYNAQMYSHAENFISEEFLKQNKIKVYYRNEDYVEGVSEWDEKYIYDETAPSSRTFIITEQSEYDKIIEQSPTDVDFDKEMVILYIFSDIYVNREYYLKKLKFDNGTLIVNYLLEYVFAMDACEPYARCFMLKMKKTEVTNVEFSDRYFTLGHLRIYY